MEITPEVDKLIKSVDEVEVKILEKELTSQYNREVFERDIYFQESRKFDGQIMETVKWLSFQESSHAQIIQLILARANINVTETPHNFAKLGNNKNEILKMNIEGENKAVQNYQIMINKSTASLRTLLNAIMSEELVHINRLQSFVTEQE